MARLANLFCLAASALLLFIEKFKLCQFFFRRSIARAMQKVLRTNEMWVKTISEIKTRTKAT